jgi:hypothetical protein
MLKRLWLGFVLAAQVLGWAQGLPAQGRPGAVVDLPAGDPERDVRTQQWQEQRILDVDDDGYASRVTGTLDLRHQANVYRHHDAQEAQDLLHQSQVARGTGVLALLFSPILGAAAGYELAQTQPGQGQDAVIRGNSSVGVYTPAGAGPGLAVGIGVLLEHREEARELRALAAESYNRALLHNLRLGTQPIRGGTMLTLGASF